MRRCFVVGSLVLTVLTASCAGGSAYGSQPGCRSGAAAADARGGAYDTGLHRVLILAAQAVPTATLLPCIRGYPEGWTFAGSQVVEGQFLFWLSSDRAGPHAVEVALTPTCDTGSAVEVPPGPDETGTHRFDQPLSPPPNYAANRFYTFAGGCIEYRYRFHGTSDARLVVEVDQALGFTPRAQLVRVLSELGLRLCGAGAPPCAGGPE